MNGAVGYVKKLGRNVAFPEGLSKDTVSKSDLARLYYHTVMPSLRRIDLNVPMVPLSAFLVIPNTGSEREWIWSCSRILSTSRGAMQNLDHNQSSTLIQASLKRSYLDTRPATAPAITTCCLEPYIIILSNWIREEISHRQTSSLRCSPPPDIHLIPPLVTPGVYSSNLIICMSRTAVRNAEMRFADASVKLSNKVHQY